MHNECAKRQEDEIKWKNKVSDGRFRTRSVKFQQVPSLNFAMPELARVSLFENLISVFTELFYDGS